MSQTSSTIKANFNNVYVYIVSSNKVLKTNRVTARNQDEFSFVLPDNGHT